MGQIFWTVLSGVSVFVIGQIVQNFVLKSLQDYLVVKGEISYKIKLYANILVHSVSKKEDINRVCGEMRSLSCQLESKYVLIWPKDIFILLNAVPNVKSVSTAAISLIQLANVGGAKGEENSNLLAVEKIKKELNIFL